MTTEEAREAADRYLTANPNIDFPGDAEDHFTAGFAAGVASGIRQAREAVAGKLADPAVSSSPAVLGVVDALAAIDALGGE